MDHSRAAPINTAAFRWIQQVRIDRWNSENVIVYRNY